jgi:hypothetical protein
MAHRPQHKSVCKKITKARAKLAEEDDLVRNATEDFLVPANAFEHHEGHFWGLHHTRDYMRARFALACENLLPVATLDAVQESLEHLQNMLKLNRSDNMGLRDIVPGLLLRLDRDQECLDFVKWWATCDPDGRYDWGDMTLPHLNLHGTDVLEGPNYLLKEFPALNHLAVTLILKLKVLVDIRNIKIVRKILSQRHLPSELWRDIESDAIRSPLSVRFLSQTSEHLSEAEVTLLRQSCQLGAAVVDANASYIYYLFDPDEALSALPELYTAGSWEEMALAMKHTFAAWWEMQGVLELLNDARACAARDSEDEIADMMGGDTFRSGQGCHRSAQELLKDVSVNRLWGYLDWAVQNASHLGPWSERPSECYTRNARQAWADAEAEDKEFEELCGDTIMSRDGDDDAALNL